MKIIVAGSRSITNYDFVEDAIIAGITYFNDELGIHHLVDYREVTAIISGHASGVDQLGERFAKESDIPLEVYPAEWNKYGRSAGYKRNQLMGMKADALIAIWDGESRGTKHMIDIAKDMDLLVYIKRRMI